MALKLKSNFNCFIKPLAKKPSWNHLPSLGISLRAEPYELQYLLYVF